MQDSAVVAAVVAGDADGFVAAYDRYATSLYGYCHRVLPGPEAAEAVLDTFLIATAKLDGLRDPDRLGPWLHAVARNECLRRLGPGGEIPAAADPGDEPLETPPADLRGHTSRGRLDQRSGSGPRDVAVDLERDTSRSCDRVQVDHRRDVVP